MKVLLLHEFSGVHTELRAALRRRGIMADIATFGDYHKGFKSDYWLGPVGGGLPGLVKRAAMQLRNLAEYRGYDIIQSISPTPFNKAVSRLVEPLLIGRAAKSRYVYLSAGQDVSYRRYSQLLPYAPPPESIEISAPDALEDRIILQADAVVACLWDYYFTLRQAGYSPIFIPLPVDTSALEARSIPVDGKLTIYHPLNRREGNDFKGTSHIRRAFAQLRDEFQSHADFIESGNMTIAEYHRFMAGVDVVVDQTNAFTYGMSGLFGLARGQVVLSGNEPATHELEAYCHSPVLNIVPDADQIASALRTVLTNRTGTTQRGRRSRLYAQTFHEADLIADQYIALYERLLAQQTSVDRG